MSSRPATDLNRILLGSAIGGAIGLVLLALGVAILWNAADQRRADTPVETTVEAGAETMDAPAPIASVEHDRQSDAGALPPPYPTVAPAPAQPAVPVLVAPPRPAPRSIWRSIFDDDADAGTERIGSQPPAAPPVEPRAAPAAATPRPAARPTTPRRPPEAQRQDDSLFF